MATHDYPTRNKQVAGIRIYSNTLLVRHGFTNLNGNWTPDDSKEHYEQNINQGRIIPSSTDPTLVRYKYNSHGYRTDEFSDFEDGSFIACFGCSYTEGTGLNNDEVWHHLVGSRVGLPVMNLGLGGGGTDVTLFNVMQYVKNKFPKPKIAILQWSNAYRKMFVPEKFAREPYQVHPVVPLGVDEPINSNIIEKLDMAYLKNRYMPYKEQAYVDKYIHYTTANLLLESIGCKVFNFTFNDDIEYMQNSLFSDLQMESISSEPREEMQISPRWPSSAWARDCSHPGTGMQMQYADKITPFIKELI